MQQVFFSSTFTDFISGKPQDVVLAPNGGAIANAAGIPKLKEEKSKNYTLGYTFSPTAATAITADLYRINIDDRIVLSGRFDADNYPSLGATLAKLGVGQAQFFVNSVNTKTQGLDLTVSNKTDFASGKLSTFLAMNYSKTDVTGVKAPSSLRGFEDVLLSERERLFIEQGGPRSKATLGFEYTQGAISTDVKIISFGAQTLGTFSGTENGWTNHEVGQKWLKDVFDRISKPKARNGRGAWIAFKAHYRGSSELESIAAAAADDFYNSGDDGNLQAWDGSDDQFDQTSSGEIKYWTDYAIYPKRCIR